MNFADIPNCLFCHAPWNLEDITAPYFDRKFECSVCKIIGFMSKKSQDIDIIQFIVNEELGCHYNFNVSNTYVFFNGQVILINQMFPLPKSINEIDQLIVRARKLKTFE